MTDRNPPGSLGPAGTSARHSVCLAAASTPGFGRRRLLATAAAAVASSLDFLQGAFEKIHFQRLIPQQTPQRADLLAQFPLAGGDRRTGAPPPSAPSDFATCTAALGESPAPSTALSRSGSFSAAPVPSSGILRETCKLVSCPLAVPFPAKVSLSRLSHFGGSLQHARMRAPQKGGRLSRSKAAHLAARKPIAPASSGMSALCSLLRFPVTCWIKASYRKFCLFLFFVFVRAVDREPSTAYGEPSAIAP